MSQYLFDRTWQLSTIHLIIKHLFETCYTRCWQGYSQESDSFPAFPWESTCWLLGGFRGKSCLRCSCQISTFLFRSSLVPSPILLLIGKKFEGGVFFQTQTLSPFPLIPGEKAGPQITLCRWGWGTPGKGGACTFSESNMEPGVVEVRGRSCNSSTFQFFEASVCTLKWCEFLGYHMHFIQNNIKTASRG